MTRTQRARKTLYVDVLISIRIECIRPDNHVGVEENIATRKPKSLQFAEVLISIRIECEHETVSEKTCQFIT